MSDAPLVYVATYEPYHDNSTLIGVFPSYAEASEGAADWLARSGWQVDQDSLVITVARLGDPESADVGAWACRMATEPHDVRSFQQTVHYERGDVIENIFRQGYPPELPPVAGATEVLVYGPTEKEAVAAARAYVEALADHLWYAQAWWIDRVYYKKPTRPIVEYALDRLKPKVGVQQVSGRTANKAIEAAIKAAGEPTYEERQSSMTSAGIVPLYVLTGTR